jgi:hypothetical protein
MRRDEWPGAARRVVLPHLSSYHPSLPPDPPEHDTTRIYAHLGSTPTAMCLESTPTPVGWFQPEFSIVAVAFVKELSHTGTYSLNSIFHESNVLPGIHQPGLFRILPDLDRHIELIKTFDSRSSYNGPGFFLHPTLMLDVCAVLSTFLTQFPGLILGTAMPIAFWARRIKPTVQRENDNRNGTRRTMGTSGA